VTIKAKIGKKTQKLKKNKYYKVTGKSVTLKVTGADSIADYTSTIKVSVFDKKGKKYKVVKPKTLTAKVKVKASEFSIVSVVSTTAGDGLTGSKYVRATFSKALDSLDASEVEIVNKSTGQLYSIEKVTLSSNKKVADVALMGDNSVARTTFLQPNTDYIFKITKDGVKGQFEFYIPKTNENEVVVEVDADKNNIKTKAVGDDAAFIGGWDGGTNTYSIPSSVKVDYQELLGTTVNITFDKTNTVEKIAHIDNEKVIYGAFKAVDEKGDGSAVYLKDQDTEDKYYAQDAVSGTIPESRTMDFGENAAPANFLKANIRAANDTVWKYGKLVLNGNGTIRMFVKLDKWSGNIMVSSVNGMFVSSKAKQEISLTDYKVLKAGKTIAVSDIKEGDVLFYNVNKKYAEVFNNTKTGALENIYDKAIKFGGKNYDTDKAEYFNASNEVKSVDLDYLKGLEASKKDVVLYLDRENTLVYLLGSEGTVASSETTLVLTEAGDGYAEKKDSMIELKGFNGTEIVTKTINVGKLTEVKVEGKEWKDTDGKITNKDFTTATSGEKITMNRSVAAGGNFDLQINGAGAGLAITRIVKVTEDKDGVITKLNVLKNNVLGAGTYFDENAAGAKDFKGGYKTINKYTLAASTPLYIVNESNKKVSAKVLPYGEFTQTVKVAAFGKINAYVDDDDTKIEYIVIDNRDGSALGEDDDGSVTSEVIIKEIKYKDKAIAELTVFSGDTEKTYTKFESEQNTTFHEGDIVKITVLKDGVTIKKDSVVNDATIFAIGTTTKHNLSNVSESKKTFSVKSGSALVEFTMASNATIAQYDKVKKEVKKITATELVSAARDFAVVFSVKSIGSKEADTIYVTETTLTSEDSTNKALALASIISGASWVDSCGGVAAFANTTDLANTFVISSKATFAEAKKAKEDIDAAVTDYTSAGTDNKFEANATSTYIPSNGALVRGEWKAYYNAKTVLDKAIKDAEDNLIVGVSVFNKITVVTGTVNEAYIQNIVSELPDSVDFTFAGDGGTRTISLDRGTYTDANGWVGADWFAAGNNLKHVIETIDVGGVGTGDITLAATGSVIKKLPSARFATEVHASAGQITIAQVGGVITGAVVTVGAIAA
jgi:hypothetical protein